MIIWILNERNLPCNMRIGCLSTCFNYLPQTVGIADRNWLGRVSRTYPWSYGPCNAPNPGSPGAGMVFPQTSHGLVHGVQGARTWMNRFEGSCRSGWKSCLSVRLRLGLVEVALELGKPHGSHAMNATWGVGEGSWKGAQSWCLSKYHRNNIYKVTAMEQHIFLLKAQSSFVLRPKSSNSTNEKILSNPQRQDQCYRINAVHCTSKGWQVARNSSAYIRIYIYYVLYM